MPSSLTDNELMLMVKNGDLDKMTLLFERHHRPLFGFLFHMTSQRDLSEDMVQSVFYRMLKYRHSFGGHGEFKSWMYYLALNVLKDEMKRNQRHNHEYDIAEFSEKLDGGNMADERIQKEEEVKILQNAMENLSDADRELLVLSQFQKLKYREIARILEISEVAVKVRVHRAFNQLKSIYLKKAAYEM